jgi:hypothetical protein
LPSMPSGRLPMPPRLQGNFRWSVFTGVTD